MRLSALFVCADDNLWSSEVSTFDWRRPKLPAEMLVIEELVDFFKESILLVLAPLSISV